jgi:hypothetical protein
LNPLALGWSESSLARWSYRARGATVAFGTPWAGTALIGANSGAALCALVHLRQASENRLRDLTRRDALDRLLPLASERSSRSLRLCHDLVGRIPSFELGFMPDGRVCPLLRELL